MRRPVSAVLALALAVACAGAAGTAEGKGPPLRTVRAGGITLGLPAGWRSSSTAGAYALLAVPADGLTSLTSVSVVRGKARADITPARWKAAIVAQMARSGIIRGTPRTRWVRLPGGRALELSFSGTIQGRRIRSLEYAWRTKPLAHVVVLTSGADSWGRYAATFRAIARSIRVR